MKNITVTVPDEIYLIARVHAARQGASVSALVRQFRESLDDRRFSDPYIPYEALDASGATPLFPVKL
jgi:hypothetical protein